MFTPQKMLGFSVVAPRNLAFDSDTSECHGSGSITPVESSFEDLFRYLGTFEYYRYIIWDIFYKFESMFTPQKCLVFLW